jgi:hypothetical protein
VVLTLVVVLVVQAAVVLLEPLTQTEQPEQ